MQLGELFKQKDCVFALEIFPPKKQSGIESVYDMIGRMEQLPADYISVTYSAGGGGSKKYTTEIARHLKQRSVEPLAHLTCSGMEDGEAEEILANMKNAGVENLLALRGDKIPGSTLQPRFTYASDLMREIQKTGGFYLAGACYPEGHPESPDLSTDIERMKYKIEAGVGHFISQLFFDNGKFFRYLNLLRKKGIDLPVEAGVMPIVRKEQIERTISLSSASLPSEFSRMVSRWADDPDSFYEAGIDYAVRQLRDLVESGVDGVHLYAMNNAAVAKRVWEGISDLFIQEGA